MHKGKGQWHKDIWNKNHEKIKQELIEVKGKIRKIDLYRRTRLSRHVIDKHLTVFERESKIIREGPNIFWKSYYNQTHRIKEYSSKIYSKVTYELQRVFETIPQEMKKTTNQILKQWTTQITYAISIALGKAFEYIPKDKALSFTEDIENIFSTIIDDNEIKKTKTGFIIQNKKSGKMLGVYNSKKNNLFIST